MVRLFSHHVQELWYKSKVDPSLTLKDAFLRTTKKLPKKHSVAIFHSQCLLYAPLSYYSTRS